MAFVRELYHSNRKGQGNVPRRPHRKQPCRATGEGPGGTVDREEQEMPVQKSSQRALAGELPVPLGTLELQYASHLPKSLHDKDHTGTHLQTTQAKASVGSAAGAPLNRRAALRVLRHQGQSSFPKDFGTLGVQLLKTIIEPARTL